MKRPGNSLIDRYIALANSASRLAGTLQGNTTRNPVESRLRRELTGVAQELAERRLTWGASGFLSARLGPRRFIFSKAGVAFESITTDDWVLQEARKVNPQDEVPGAWIVHGALYEAQPAARVIGQVQPAFASVLVALDKIEPLPLPEVGSFWTSLAQIESGGVNDRELAGAVAAASKQSNIILIKNRGMTCWSASPTELVPLVQTLESSAQMVWLYTQSKDSLGRTT
jgi:ribulose-5-phosphate 4-epimerase/fuculose-1-phosphate aldolase